MGVSPESIHKMKELRRENVEQMLEFAIKYLVMGRVCRYVMPGCDGNTPCASCWRGYLADMCAGAALRQQAEVAKLQGHENIVIVARPVLEVMRKAPGYSPPAPRTVQRSPKQTLQDYYDSHDMQEDFLDLIKEAEGWTN